MAGRSIFFEKARTVVAATLKEGRSPGLQPLTVAVLGPDGHLLAFARDHTSYLRPQIAMAKAAGALALGLSTRVMAEMAVERPTFISSIGVVSPVGVVPAPRGLLIMGMAKSSAPSASPVTSVTKTIRPPWWASPRSACEFVMTRRGHVCSRAIHS